MDNQYINENNVENIDEETSPPVSPISQSLHSSILSLIIFTVFELETPITELEIVRLFQNMLPLNIRLSSTMERNNKGVLRWKKVVTRVEDHLIVPTFPLGLARETYDEYLREYLSKIGCVNFSENKPLWELHLVKYPSLNGACSLIFKASHAISDGYSLVSLFCNIFQRADHPSLPFTFPQMSFKKQGDGKRTVIGMGNKMLGFMRKCVNTISDLMESSLRATFLEDRRSAIRPEAWTNMKIELFRPFDIYSVTLSLKRVKQVKTKLGATVNDVITGLLSYIIHLYTLRKTMVDHNVGDGLTPDFINCGTYTKMTLLVMSNMRVFDGFTNIEDMIRAVAWGNRSRAMFAELPTFINAEKVNPVDFIIKAKEIMDKKKNSMLFYFIDKVLNIAFRIQGQKGMDEMIYSSFRNTSTSISSVIGPKEKIAICNQPVNSVYFFVSGIPQSLTFTSVSCMEQLNLVVKMEKGFIDSKLFGSCMDEAFDNIFQAAFEDNQDKDD
ncbi:hypothetical protein C5167_004309 [Papaver somniferum]|uniref:Uncharacterized protein n=1 Tax=Papaver somniferum TaxID=3469 RepID=A0A4Y7J961_PAPSO|nr:O-acyltransferase WSD1-like isoform X1 [Papaver somniferum]RZC57006.1 hypothetical protein C5167_004309 [Papaver somniferum]